MFAMGSLLAALFWQSRPDLDALEWQAVTADAPPTTVSATWFGISTLLFDDGETQILVDAAFTRLTPLDVLLQRKVQSDLGEINLLIDDFRMRRIAAIVPVHARYDHAIDVGNMANRTSAIVLGSESIANVARGADVPVDQYQILADRESRHFGNFTIKVIKSSDPPVGPAGEAWFSGRITEPLEQPARSAAWRGETPATIVIEHPNGVSLIQGSASVPEGLLRDVNANVVFLSVAGLGSLGQEHAERYWQEAVTTTGADRVVAIHYDDFTQPLGETALFPTFFDDVPAAAAWLNDLAAASSLAIERPVFGRPIQLY